jgi:sec-independent protein translocase protein TatB
MFGIGAPELVVILVVALVVLGPKRLPELAKGLGKTLGEFRRATSGITEELGNARVMLEEEVRQAEQTAQQGDTGDTPAEPNIANASDAAAKIAPSILASGAESTESNEAAPAGQEPQEEKPAQ